MPVIKSGMDLVNILGGLYWNVKHAKMSYVLLQERGTVIAMLEYLWILPLFSYFDMPINKTYIKFMRIKK